jgi:tetratricopeptide (TPR) repeat protein
VKIQAGTIYLSARLYDRALEQHRHVLAIAPDARGVRTQIGMTLVLMGRCSEGLAELRHVEVADGIAGELDPEIDRAWSAAVCGERTEAERLLRRFEEASDPGSDLDVAILLAVLGRRDEAFARLERTYRHRDDGLTWVLGSPLLDPIRSDPRFRDLAQRVGIPSMKSS